MRLVSLLYPVAVEGTNNISSDRFACTRVASNVPDATQHINMPKYTDVLSQGFPAGQNQRRNPSANATRVDRRASRDLDSDGYANLEEYLNGTDPTRPKADLKIKDPAANLKWTPTPWLVPRLRLPQATSRTIRLPFRTRGHTY